MIWKPCGDSFVWRGTRAPESPGAHLFSDEDAVYVDLAGGIVWEVLAHENDPSALIRAISLLQHPEIIETLNVRPDSGFGMLIDGLSGIDDVLEAKLWFNGLPDETQLSILDSVVDIFWQLEGMDQVDFMVSERVLAGDVREALERHGIHC